MTIQEAQNTVDNWIKENGVRYFDELTNFSILVEEVGELARIFSRKYGEQSYKKDEENIDPEEEFGDVFWILLALSNQTGINLEDSLNKSLIKKTNRDKYRHYNNPKLK